MAKAKNTNPESDEPMEAKADAVVPDGAAEAKTPPGIAGVGLSEWGAFPITPVLPDPINEPAAVKAPPNTRRALVHTPGTHVGSIEVFVPRDATNPEKAAIQLAKDQRGIVHFGVIPTVEFLEN